MNGPTPTTAAAPTFDPCAMLDGIEARLVHLADLITRQDQDITEEATGTDNPNILTTRAARAAGQRQA